MNLKTRFALSVLLGAASSLTLRAQASTQALGFVPINPCRLVDTRNPSGPLGGPSIAGGGSRDFTPAIGDCGIPSSAVAYALNVTVVPYGPLGYITLWPAGYPEPVVSTMNSLDGRIKADAAIVPAGVGGAISVSVTDDSDVILDIDGYFVPNTTPSALAYYPLNPCRVLDTRQSANGLFTSGESRVVPMLSSPCGIPSSASVYSLNFTVIPRGPLGYLNTWPDGTAQPFVSTLNALTGTAVANAALVPAGYQGDIDVSVTDPTDLVIDINGYFAPPGQSGGLWFYAVNPCRVVDTRQSNGTFGGPSLVGGQAVTFPITEGACGIPSNAQAYSFNATVVPRSALGFLALWPSDLQQPLVSTLNAFDGSLVSNAALVPGSVSYVSGNTPPLGSINVYVSDDTDLLLDVNGYFAP